VFAFVNGQPVDGFLGALPKSQVSDRCRRVRCAEYGGPHR
jgi:thioredoxin-like negative regulator of GroEL